MQIGQQHGDLFRRQVPHREPHARVSVRRVIFCIVELLRHPDRQPQTHPENTEVAPVSRRFELPPRLNQRSPRLARRYERLGKLLDAGLQPLPRAPERLKLAVNPGDPVASFGASHHACLPRIGTTSAPVPPTIAPSRSAHRSSAARFSAP